jgi:hypothetical protein
MDIMNLDRSLALRDDRNLVMMIRMVVVVVVVVVVMT